MSTKYIQASDDTLYTKVMKQNQVAKDFFSSKDNLDSNCALATKDT